MDFSDDEELLPESVSNYYFVDGTEEPVSFCILPYRWQDGQDVGPSKKQVFLHGVGDDGLQKIYKQVTEWKLELEGIRPVIYVLSKDQKWLQLLKPRKSYEEIIRKILVTTQCLHYIRNNPEASEKSLFAHLKKEFSHFEVRPSPEDLVDHVPFIRELSQKDEAFAKCQLLPSLLDGTLGKMLGSSGDLMETKNSEFINDEDDKERNGDTGGKAAENDSDEEEDCFDSVCTLCDNGGDLICCEGRCLRSFHAVKDPDTDCKTLGYSRVQLKGITNFLCPNCRFKQHQCYACGKLGSSDKTAGAEVFPCVSATCGHFYHPKCVAKLLHPKNESDALEQEKKIASGATFICPVHKCVVCKQGENKAVEELQFGVCRRCPTAYHRKCLPSDINFAASDSDSDSDDDTEKRAWNNLLPNRILIYCLKHKIDPDLGTPLRNHIKFPEDPDAREKKKIVVSRTKVLGKKTSQDLSEEQPPMKKAKLIRRPSIAEENEIATKKFQQVPAKKEAELSKADKTITRDRAKVSSTKKSLLRDLLISKNESASTTNVKKIISLPEIDSETKNRIMSLARRSSASSLTLENFIKQKDIPSTHSYAARHVDKTVTLGRVEGSIEAIQTALQKVVEDDGNTDNAKAVCEPGIVLQVTRWRSKLSIYLSPFLHGLLYTSFGRHFTKVDKLKEIVERLHWYVQSGDTIVDFCCGANDFSSLMKEKLEATGKKCLYRNFDIIPPKNDFNFVRRDWMKVCAQDLPSGSQFIMGLNPPFGVKGALANKFIDKALEFRPKIVILIVPKETERLDVKRGVKYDLVWEDDQKLSGKAFYMPGNVDVNDKLLEQWNVSPPPLYLWSRPDWTHKHKEIAKQHGHLSNNYKQSANVASETKIPSPVRGEKTEQIAEPKKVEALDSNRKADVKESKLDEKKNLESSRNWKQREGGKREIKNPSVDSEEVSDMSILPHEMEIKKEFSTATKNEQEHWVEKESSEIAVQKATAGQESHEGFLGTGSLSKERLNVKDNNNTQQTTWLEADHSAGGAYASRRSEERYQGFGGGNIYGLSDRSIEVLHSDKRLYGQSRTADIRSDGRAYGSASSGYGASVSGLGMAGNSPAPYGYADSALRSSVSDRYARLGEMNPGLPTSRLGEMSPGLPSSRLGEMSPALPSSLLGPSTTDKYAPRLDDLTYTRRNTTTIETSALLSRYSVPNDTSLPSRYGNPGASSGGNAQAGSRYPSSGWLND